MNQATVCQVVSATNQVATTTSSGHNEDKDQGARVLVKRRSGFRYGRICATLTTKTHHGAAVCFLQACLQCRSSGVTMVTRIRGS